jgi:hypothetical protein
MDSGNRLVGRPLRYAAIFVAALGLSLELPAYAQAQEGAYHPRTGAESGWSFVIELRGWFPFSVQGTALIDNQLVQVDADARDIVDHAQFGSSVRFEAWLNRRWGLV